MSWQPEYGYPKQFHDDVVKACVELMGEENRAFFDDQCSYEDEYAEGMSAYETAEAQLESLS